MFWSFFAAACDAIADGLADMFTALASLLDCMFSIRKFYFYLKISNVALNVRFSIDMTILGFKIDFVAELELNFEKLMEQLAKHFLAKFAEGEKDDEEDRRRLGSNKNAVFALGRAKRTENYHSRMLRESSNEDPGFTRDVAEEDEATVDAVSSQVRQRGHTAATQVEALAIDFYGKRASNRRERRSRVDRIRKSFDTNRGLDNLCDELERRKLIEGVDVDANADGSVGVDENCEIRRLGVFVGFEEILQTNAVPRRSSGYGFTEVPHCLFSHNPRLRRVVVEGQLAGNIPEGLSDDNELELFSVTRARLTGSWDGLLSSARQLSLFSVQGNEVYGEVTRGTWPTTMEYISFVDNVALVDIGVMFDSMQDLSGLRSVFWDRNTAYLKEGFGRNQDRKSLYGHYGHGLSTHGTRINPDFSVLYGSVRLTNVYESVCGKCKIAIVSPSSCFTQSCADLDVFEEIETGLKRTLMGMHEGFTEFKIETLKFNDELTFRSQVPFLDGNAQGDILQGIEASVSDNLPNYNIKKFQARFGCTPGAVGPQCEYVCQLGWRRFDKDNGRRSPWPQCAEPEECPRACTKHLRATMDTCTNALYDKTLQEQCIQMMNDAQEVCQSCRTFTAQATDYDGFVSRTVDGVKCLPWQQVDSPINVHAHKRKHNYCRNDQESSKDTAWCFTGHDGDWGYCDVGSATKARCHNDGASCFELALLQFQEIFR